MMLAQRRRHRLLLVIALVAAAAVQHTCADTTAQAPETARSPKPGGKKRRPPPPSTDGGPSPAPTGGKRRRPPPADAGLASPPLADSPPLMQSPPMAEPPLVAASPPMMFSPPLVESPPPPPEPSPPPPAPAPPPPSPPPNPTLKLILEITGAPFPMDDTQLQAVASILSTYSNPYPYTIRTQTPSAPGVPPMVNATAPLPTFTPIASAPPPAATTSKRMGGDGKKGGKHGGKKHNSTSADGGRRLLRMLGAAVLPHGAPDLHSGAYRALLESKSGGICTKDSSFIVATPEECAAECQRKIEGKADTYEFNRATLDESGSNWCCDCRIKKGVPQPDPLPDAATEVYARSGEVGNVTWWPTDEPVVPVNRDGTYVFADSQPPAAQIPTIQQNILAASNSGELCSQLKKSNVDCDSTTIMFNNVGEVKLNPNATSAGTESTTTTSSDGLSTGAIVGIAVGGAAVLVAIVIAISMFVSCRRERRIEQAAKMRTMQRREATAPVEGESRWRQMYSARMSESMRRTEEASERQRVQGSGPSFVEMQDRAYSQEAQQAERATPQRSGSKRGFTRGTPNTDVGTPNLQRDSPDHSLMTGSELSSPAPSASSLKAGKSRSLKNLFGSGKK